MAAVLSSGKTKSLLVELEDGKAAARAIEKLEGCGYRLARRGAQQEYLGVRSRNHIFQLAQPART